MAQDLMPPLTIDADLAREILRRFCTEDEVRVKFATKSREALHEARGEEPQGHRVEWVTATTGKVVKALLEAAEEFNGTYPYDIILLGDFLDVLATVKGRLVRSAEGA